jgi:hypothetical protein
MAWLSTAGVSAVDDTIGRRMNMVGKALKQWLRAAVFCLETYPVFSRLFVYHQIQSFHYDLPGAIGGKCTVRESGVT